MEPEQISQWHFQPNPFDGESFSHFLGRYCALNCITPNTLAQHITAGTVAIGRWRKLRYNPPPSTEHIQRLAVITGVGQNSLLAMLPQEPMQIGTVRLCAVCYGEQPCHQMNWQYKSTEACQRHGLTLLSRCPQCKAPFPVPADWGSGVCLRCGATFENMAVFQKKVC